MSRFDLISDISLLTTLPDKTLRKLCDKGVECICHDVLECLNESNNEVTIDISIGELKIVIVDDEIHYKFRPSTQLETMLVKSIVDREDPLVSHIEEGLVSRILNAYKDLI
jgi:hypothetical protein